MNEMRPLDSLGTVRPRLADFARLELDRTRDVWIVQAPERVLVLDESAKAILEQCQGNASIDEIVSALAGEFDAPADEIEHDVRCVLGLLEDQGFLVLQS